jgi:uncharacterized cupin superfamily protein
MEETMSEIQIKEIDEVEPYRGPQAREGIEFRAVGRALGVTAFGMNVIDMAPGATTYPEHDHSEDGQEEIFLVLEGDATLRCDGEEQRVESGTLVRIPPEATRSWHPGDRGVTLLAIGGTPGKPYQPRS